MRQKKPRPKRPFKKGDRVFYADDPSWRGTVERLEDLDGDGKLTVVVNFDSLAGHDSGSTVDGLEFEEIQPVSKLPIIERLAELGRAVQRR